MEADNSTYANGWVRGSELAGPNTECRKGGGKAVLGGCAGGRAWESLWGQERDVRSKATF